MNQSNIEIVKTMLSYIKKLSERDISSWTEFRISSQILDNAFLTVYEELKSGKTISQEDLNEIIKKVDKQIETIDRNNHELDHELNEYIDQIESAFQKNIKYCQGPYYFGQDMKNTFIGFPPIIRKTGEYTMWAYRDKYVWFNHVPRYSLDGLPPFKFKEFIPDILAYFKDNDLFKSLYIYYASNFTQTLAELLKKQSKAIYDEYASLANTYAQETEWDKDYKSLYIDSQNNGICMEFKFVNYGKGYTNEISNNDTETPDSNHIDFSIIPRNVDCNVDCNVIYRRQSKRWRLLSNIELSDSYDCRRFRYEEYDELTNFLGTFSDLKLKVNEEKSFNPKNKLYISRR